LRERQGPHHSAQKSTNTRAPCSVNALTVTAFVAAAGVLVARLRPEWGAVLLVCGWLLPVLVVVFAALGFRCCRPATGEVALRLDRAAGLDEHLTTWDEIRRRALPDEPVSRSFALLQRASTLREAEGLRPWRLLPLALPGWTRVLWLGLMALGCATLMPEHRPEAGRVLGTRTGRDAVAGRPDGGHRRLAAAEPKDALRRIEILSPADMLKYSAMAFGPDVPEALKEEALRELEAKVGALREADLSPDVRALLEGLRKQVSTDAGTNVGNGSTSVNGKPANGSGSHADSVGAANPPTPQQAMQVVRDRFRDVAEALGRYYLEGGP